jgi:5,10-methenyltetrahydromethanopterin hydrogenase
MTYKPYQLLATAGASKVSVSFPATDEDNVAVVDFLKSEFAFKRHLITDPHCILGTKKAAVEGVVNRPAALYILSDTNIITQKDMPLCSSFRHHF